MAVSYAGVTLPTPNAEDAAWVEANLSLNDILEFSRLNWPSFSLLYTAFPGTQEQRSKIRLGRLFWPRGASRWSMYHGIVDDATLTAIRTAMGSAYTAQPFVMTWINAQTNLEVTRITTNLFLLPPRPLSQIAGANGHWLLTLVDDRFFWWQRSTGALSVTEGTTTWADLYASLGAQLGFIITADPVPAAYLKPSFFLGIPYAYTPILLDAVAFNVGQRVVRGLDGTIRARNPVNAALDVAANRALATAAFKQAGGVFNFNPLSMPNDDPGLLPFEVTMTFPKVDADSGSNVPNGQLLAVSAPLNTLALTDIPPTTPTSGGAKVFHDNAPAKYLASVLQNNAELQALVNQMATDWYRFQLALLDVKLAGIVPWEPDALHDWVEWSYAAFAGPQAQGDACTRICRGPFNDLTDQTQHGGGVGGPSEPPGSGTDPDMFPTFTEQNLNGTGRTTNVSLLQTDQSTGLISSNLGPGNALIRIDWTTSGTPPIVLIVFDITVGGPITLPPGTSKLRFIGAGDITITTIAGAVDGQLLFVENIGGGRLKIQHNAGANGILNPLPFDYTLQNRDGIIIQFDGTAQRWRYDVPTLAAGSGTPEYTTRLLLPGAGISITGDGFGTATIAASTGTTVGDIHFWHHTSDGAQWYSWLFCKELGQVSTTDGKYWAMPFLTTQTLTASRIGTAVQNSDIVSRKTRLAVYSNTGPKDLYPNLLLADSGDISVAPGGFVSAEAAISVAMPPGLYWLVLQDEVSALLHNNLSIERAYGILGRISVPLGPPSVPSNFWVAGPFAYGAFPANFPGAGSQSGGGFDIWIEVT